MKIWKVDFKPSDLNQGSVGNMGEHVGIEFIEAGDDFLAATMPVDHRTKQPAGILHGGASVVLAETLGSVASHLCIDLEKNYAVGLDINANHLRAVNGGFVKGIAKPIHLGRSTHVWEIKIFNDEGKITCISRLTMAILSR
ncbi:MAG: hotdog fold thioesterase [Sphingobacteriales bacterium JAD_PAG50586_3]|nr:MAG: hotdog fold thioesterase [Sphingobacteriales bacterium JAD_PAG50586_3]